MKADINRPISDYWALSIKKQPNCIDQTLYLEISGIVNSCTDLLVVCIPIRTVLKLKMPRRQKLLVILLFAVGGIVCVAGGFRVYFTWKDVTTPDRWDTSWNIYPAWISSSVELFVGMVRLIQMVVTRD